MGGSINRLYTYVGILKVMGLLMLFCDLQKNKEIYQPGS